MFTPIVPLSLGKRSLLLQWAVMQRLMAAQTDEDKQPKSSHPLGDIDILPTLRLRERHRRVGRDKGHKWGDPAAKEYLLVMMGPLHSGPTALCLLAQTCTGPSSSHHSMQRDRTPRLCP